MYPKAIVHSTTAGDTKKGTMSDPIHSYVREGRGGERHSPPASVTVNSKIANAIASKMRMPAMTPLTM